MLVEASIPRSSGAAVTGHCALHGYWDSNLCPLQEQCVLVTAEPLLHPKCFFKVTEIIAQKQKSSIFSFLSFFVFGVVCWFCFSVFCFYVFVFFSPRQGFPM